MATVKALTQIGDRQIRCCLRVCVIRYHGNCESSLSIKKFKRIDGDQIEKNNVILNLVICISVS